RRATCIPCGGGKPDFFAITITTAAWPLFEDASPGSKRQSRSCPIPASEPIACNPSDPRCPARPPPVCSREAAKECSPRRKAWVEGKTRPQPQRGERNGSRATLRVAPYGAGICTLAAIFEYPLSWLLVFTAVAA